ncbi:MAG: BamA/TamA family outer membrane protein [Deltaproteobacteria bacterium]|nr:BamA/TamA family outer membrane protein [Deltaproteobacteria bacterium]
MTTFSRRLTTMQSCPFLFCVVYFVLSSSFASLAHAQPVVVSADAESPGDEHTSKDSPSPNTLPDDDKMVLDSDVHVKDQPADALKKKISVDLKSTVEDVEAGKVAEDAPKDPHAPRWGFAATPKVILNSDTGFGLGLRGNAFLYAKGALPYKAKIGAQVYMTTKLIQDHYLSLDAIDVFDLPIRVLGQVGYYQNIVQNFCGFGNQTTCDENIPRRQALAMDLNPAERVEFVNRYYQHRYIRPYARGEARWRFNQKPNKVEIFGGVRAHLYQSGDWFDNDDTPGPDLYPYPGSLFDKTYPDGDSGLATVFQAGIMLDNRDNEPAPSKGYWLEASARVAPPGMSRWIYGAVNGTVRCYLPLMGKTLVLAQRYVVDLAMGDMPVQEMVRIGGSFDYTAFGGREIGRGIRVQRQVGRIKVLSQQELRYNLPSFELLYQELQFGFAAFLDGGVIGQDWGIPNTFVGRPVQDFGGDPFAVAIGAGVSFRFIWNQNFVMRLDLAFSPVEGYRPSVYSGPDHPF